MTDPHRADRVPTSAASAASALALGLCLLAAPAVHASEALAALPDRGAPPVATDAGCEASIHARDDHALLYRMTREHRPAAAGGGAIVRWSYRHPDGRLAAEERIAYGAGGALERYEMRLEDTGERALAEVEDEQLSLSFQEGAERDVDSEPHRPETVVNDQVVPLLQRHWTRIERGEPVETRVVVPSRTMTLAFELRKIADTRYRDTDAIVVEMRPSSWIIAQLVDPFRFTLEKHGAHRLLEYEGRTTPKQLADGRWTDLDAVVVYRNCFADRVDDARAASREPR